MGQVKIERDDHNIAREEFTEEQQAFFQGWQPVAVVTWKDVEESHRVGQSIRYPVLADSRSPAIVSARPRVLVQAKTSPSRSLTS